MDCTFASDSPKNVVVGFEVVVVDGAFVVVGFEVVVVDGAFVVVGFLSVLALQISEDSGRAIAT